MHLDAPLADKLPVIKFVILRTLADEAATGTGPGSRFRQTHPHHTQRLLLAHHNFVNFTRLESAYRALRRTDLWNRTLSFFFTSRTSRSSKMRGEPSVGGKTDDTSKCDSSQSKQAQGRVAISRWVIFGA